MSYNDMRRAYQRGELDQAQLPDDPLELFTAWMEAAVQAGELEPNAMALATVSGERQPHVRFVLLKDATPAGFVFFSNYESRKGRDLEAVARASLAFWWPRTERQVRVDGTVAKLAVAESDAYFHSRPRGSQVGAWAARQGQPIPDRRALEDAVERYTQQFGAGPVERPPYWGGYVVTPQRMEFWQGRRDRLHDRFEYRREAGDWGKRRLAP